MNKYNTFWKRFVAAIIDSFVLWPLSLLNEYQEAYAGELLFSIGILIFSIAYNAYFVLMHAKYGQTIGKKILGIKVVDIDEVTILNFKRSAIRESPWIIANFIFFLYLLVALVLFKKAHFEKAKTDYENIAAIISITWILIEFLTMLTNYKRRALHDYLAGSVVIKTDR